MLFMDILYLGVADRLIWVASSLKEFNVRCTIVNLRKLEKDLFFFSSTDYMAGEITLKSCSVSVYCGFGKHYI